MENVRPASIGEEELQLQLALAMSREEHEEEQRKMKSDDIKLQMALDESRKTQEEVGTTVKRPPSKRLKIKFGLKTNYCLMQVKSIAECSKGSILQCFQPSLSYHLSLRSWFCLCLSGRFTQVLRYLLRISSVLCLLAENFFFCCFANSLDTDQA